MSRFLWRPWEWSVIYSWKLVLYVLFNKKIYFCISKFTSVPPCSGSYKDFDHSQWWESIEKKILCIENLFNKIFFLWESIQKNILSGENPLRKKISLLRICWITFSTSENLFTKYSLWWESIKKKILCIENLLNKIFSLWEPIQKIFSVVRIL